MMWLATTTQAEFNIYQPMDYSKIDSSQTLCEKLLVER